MNNEKFERLWKRLVKKTEHIDDLIKVRKIRQALYELRFLFWWCSLRRIPLPIHFYIYGRLQLSTIYNLLERHKEALDELTRLELVIRQEGSWYQHLPEKLVLAVPSGFTSPVPLSEVFTRIALVNERLKNTIAAKNYFLRAINSFLSNNDKVGASETWTKLAYFNIERAEYDNALRAIEAVQTLGDESANVQIQLSAIELYINYYAHLEKWDQALESETQLIDALREQKIDVGLGEMERLYYIKMMQNRVTTGENPTENEPLALPKDTADKLLEGAVETLKQFARKQSTTAAQSGKWRAFLMRDEPASNATHQQLFYNQKNRKAPLAVLEFNAKPFSMIVVRLLNINEYGVSFFLETRPRFGFKSTLKGVYHRAILAQEDALYNLLMVLYTNGVIKVHDGILRVVEES